MMAPGALAMNAICKLRTAAFLLCLFATLTASLVTTSGRSAWFVGVLAIMVYLIFAIALYLLPPQNT